MKKTFLDLKIFIIFLTFFNSEPIVAQLGFCQGNSGDPIFTETFGTGLTDSPLPAGTTTYTYANGMEPIDGLYTVSSNTNYFDWFNIQDHTPNDTNGKMLIVNSSFSAGEFYNTTITGLCENTSYEFSSWIINLTPTGGFCGADVIPINMRFEIWDDTNTNLLASGNTGSIGSTSAPIWNQYALVFQTIPGQTSVILKMINNGVGGCGNDLAIDDIVFKSCGDFIGVSDDLGNDNTSICEAQTPFSTTITATPDGTVFSNHFYQWQESSDGVIWNDIPGETNQTLSVVANTSMLYRAKVAEFAANLNNIDCITFSDVYILTVSQPEPPVLECWETATFNPDTCMWEVSGTQPEPPTDLQCWETIIFNDITCNWQIVGNQPPEPTGLECWQTTNFNISTCSWDILGTQPEPPTDLECWETPVFNSVTCSWEVTGTQPPEPTDLECWETATFNINSCDWEITGTQVIEMLEISETICEEELLQLQAEGGILNATYLWSTGETTEFITVDSAGIYTVLTTDGCSAIEKTIHVESVELPIIEDIISDGNDIIVVLQNTGDFLYSIDGISFQSNPIFYDVVGGKYTVYVTPIDCDYNITVEHLHFYIPKFFTPNNDTVNDTFNLVGIDCFETSEVLIFDRYGKLLFSAKNRDVSWDGTFNNNPLPTNAYWYKITVDGKEFKGHFTLKR